VNGLADPQGEAAAVASGEDGRKRSERQNRWRPLPHVFQVLSPSQKEFGDETKHGTEKMFSYREKVRAQEGLLTSW
jgi:hypothetical protein